MIVSISGYRKAIFCQYFTKYLEVCILREINIMNHWIEGANSFTASVGFNKYQKLVVEMFYFLRLRQ